MNMKIKYGALALTIAAALLSSCKKDNEKEQILVKETEGVYILCEGSSGSNNSMITYYDIEKQTTVNDYYKQINGKDLGETAVDLKVYGSKMYCVVSGIQGSAKSFVDVMDVKTGKTIKRISFNTTDDGYLPRYIAFYKNKAYVSRYDGKISRIDTSSLSIDSELQLKNGDNNAAALEGLAVANGKLYVAGSAHYLYANSLNDKVVVVDLTTFAQTKDITVNYNPQKIGVTESGDLFVTSWGNYADIKPALQKISSSTDAVTQTESNTDLGEITVVGNQAWVTKDVWSTPSIKALDIATGKIGADLITDGTSIVNPYGLTVDALNQNVVVADALSYGSSTGKAFVFGKDGKLKYSFETGPTPQHAAFKYRYVYKSL